MSCPAVIDVLVPSGPVVVEVVTPGPPGPIGSKWITGSGVPGSGVGAVGDFYLRENGDVYGPKASGGWGSVQFTLTGSGGAALSDDAPQALGAAAAGTSIRASRSDHRHAMPNAAQVGADATGTAAAAIAAHVAAADAHPGYTTPQEAAAAAPVQSVALSPPSGWSTSTSNTGGSVTLTLGLPAGFSLPSNASQSLWDTAYSERLQWNGGSTGLNAATGRASLGLEAVAASGAYGDLSGRPTLGTAAPLDVAVAGDASATQVVKGNDTRLSDSRTPRAHNQGWSTITSTPTSLAGYGITDAVGTSDARLSDSREWIAATVSQAQAEAGTSTSRLAFTPLRVFQAVAAYIAANFSATGQALSTAASAAAARTTLGLGTAATAATGDFAAASHTQAANTISDSTTAGRALLTAVDAAAQRTSLGLGSLATQSGTFSGTSSGTNTGDQDLSGLLTSATAATTYQPLSANLTALGGNGTAYYLARANHTGTQAAGTITGLATVATSGAYSDLSGQPTLFNPATPGAIGDTTPAAGAFTALTTATTWGLRSTVTASSGTYSLDVTAANEFSTSAAIAGAITINLSNLSSIPTGYVWRGVLRFSYTSGTITWFSGNTGYSVKWDGGAAPTPTASEQEAVVIEVVGGGSIIEVAALRGRA